MFAKLLEQRVRPIAEQQLSNAQFGFRKGKGCTDAIFTMRQLCEKTIEYNDQLNIVFIDQEKAFDRVERYKLWSVLEIYGIQGQLLENIMALYNVSQSAVKTPDGTSDLFAVNTGVRQGCVLSPLLFNIYIDRISKEANQEIEAQENLENSELYTPDEKLEKTSINELLFADDQCLLYNNDSRLQEHVNNLTAICERYNMKINRTKTEIMKVSRTHGPLNIYLDNTPLKQVQEFKYLGSMITEDGRMDREIETRCQKANTLIYQLTPLLTHPNIPMTTKQQIINSIFIPTLCYQCQSWTLTKSQLRKINTCEMKCLRRAANLTIRDRVRNDTIRQIVGTTPCATYIERQKIKWFGHVTRMQHHQLPAQALYQRSSGARARGRPRRKWIDDIKDIVESHGMTITSATHRAIEHKLSLPTTPFGISG